MRKIVSLTLTLILALLFTCQAQAEDTAFVKGEPHTHTADFRLYFDTMTAQIGRCTVNIQEKIFDEETAAELACILAADTDKLPSLLGKQEDLGQAVVFVVEKAPKGVQRFGSRIYCTQEDVLSGKYLPWLYNALLPGNDAWKGVGLAQLAKEKIPQRAELTEYLKQASDLDILSLHMAYFYPDFADASLRDTATQLAGALCEMVLRRDGAQTLLTTHCYEYRQMLLDEWGVAREYSDPYQGFDEDFVYTDSLWYSFAAVNARGDEFYIKPPAYGMDSPRQVRRFLYEAVTAPQAILAGVKKDAPAFAEEIQQNYSAPITYRIDPDAAANFTNYRAREILLRSTGAVVHETVHLLLPGTYHTTAILPSQWEVEAAAEYLTYAYFPPEGNKGIYYRYLTETTADDLPLAENQEAYEEILMWLAANELYMKDCGMPASVALFDTQTYIKALVKALHLLPFDLPWYRRSVAGAYGEEGSWRIAEGSGNELTYNEAHCFAAYLIDEYGLNAFLEYYTADKPYQYEEVYGLPYETLKQRWLAAE